ncbi:hypothetical protein BJ170DRAFT_355733 [Xylariales sp. AK1849]|nr:hypothetical protein BJ170DRAFT_355733 [Xylariales sp. AK1849]
MSTSSRSAAAFLVLPVPAPNSTDALTTQLVEPICRTLVNMLRPINKHRNRVRPNLGTQRPHVAARRLLPWSHPASSSEVFCIPLSEHPKSNECGAFWCDLEPRCMMIWRRVSKHSGGGLVCLVRHKGTPGQHEQLVRRRKVVWWGSKISTALGCREA